MFKFVYVLLLTTANQTSKVVCVVELFVFSVAFVMQDSEETDRENTRSSISDISPARGAKEGKGTAKRFRSFKERSSRRSKRDKTSANGDQRLRGLKNRRA